MNYQNIAWVSLIFYTISVISCEETYRFSAFDYALNLEGLYRNPQTNELSRVIDTRSNAWELDRDYTVIAQVREAVGLPPITAQDIIEASHPLPPSTQEKLESFTAIINHYIDKAKAALETKNTQETGAPSDRTAILEHSNKTRIDEAFKKRLYQKENAFIS